MTGTIGLLITVAALVLLLVRVAAGAARLDRAGSSAGLRALDVALVPVLVAFVAVIVIRFDRLSL